MDKIHYTIYKTTNLKNGKFYIGAHSTNNLEDGYLGSGKLLQEAIKKYGINNFKKEILYTYDNPIDMYNKESEIVNDEFVKKESNYNLKNGGEGGRIKNMVNAFDSLGNRYFIDCETFKNNENLFGYLKNKVVVKDNTNNILLVDKNDVRYLQGELKPIACGKVNVKDFNGNKFQVDISDDRYIRGELKHVNSGLNEGTIPVKDKDGNRFRVSKNDTRYLSGELVYIAKNSCWINKDGMNKVIDKCNLSTWVSNGWTEGRINKTRKDTCYINNGKSNKRVNISELDSFLSDGWVQGLIKKLK